MSADTVGAMARSTMTSLAHLIDLLLTKMEWAAERLELAHEDVRGAQHQRRGLAARAVVGAEVREQRPGKDH